VSTVAVPRRLAPPELRAMRLTRAAAIVAVIALGLWMGGLVALGACAAPMVFSMVPAPWSGDAMGAAFRRFDAVAITCAVVVLGCEAVRLRLAPTLRRGPATARERARAVFAIVAAGAAIYAGVQVSPKIMALHAAGAIRGLDASGLLLEKLHRVAETLGKIEIAVGLLLIVLEVLTLEDVRDESE
jgi:hypothetical protein